jgi:hypothetical protein
VLRLGRGGRSWNSTVLPSPLGVEGCAQVVRRHLREELEVDDYAFGRRDSLHRALGVCFAAI